jgi:molybdopterin converting factor small subunit
MIVAVRLFARAKDLANADSVNVQLDAGGSVKELRTALASAYPQLRGIVRNSAFSVNDEFADDGTKVSEDSDVALIPPVSGG